MKSNETVLSNYKMQFLWTFVAFAGLRNKNLGLSRRDDSYSSSGSRDGSSLVIDDENEKNHFVPNKGTMDFNINQLFRMENDRLSDEKICAQVVEVCKNAKAFDKKSVNCEFSISIGSSTGLYNIKSDDHFKTKPWFEDRPARGKIVREFPHHSHVPRPFLEYRNILFISPKSVNFTSHSRARNIAVKIELKNEIETVSSIIEADGHRGKSYYTSVSYHKSVPLFIDETKLEIPENLTPDHHLFFTFYHISVKEGNESVIGYSWLPLLDGSEQILNGLTSLPVCVQPPPNGYGRVGPDVNLPGVKWYDNRKALFTLDIKVDSTIHILDRHIHSFAKHLISIRLLHESPSSFCTIAGKRIPVSQLSGKDLKSILIWEIVEFSYHII